VKVVAHIGRLHFCIEVGLDAARWVLVGLSERAGSWLLRGVGGGTSSPPWSARCGTCRAGAGVPSDYVSVRAYTRRRSSETLLELDSTKYSMFGAYLAPGGVLDGATTYGLPNGS
jgi:hypothetical protein